MNILIINGSPKGKNSVTLQTARYIEALHPEHSFNIIHAGQRIKALERDFSEAKASMKNADLILFCYPVYTFVAPYQLHRFIELTKEHNVNLKDKFVSQITTSKHFYDSTAHRYIEENCFDLQMKVIKGLSADMDDLLTQKGQEEARMFFDSVMFTIENGGFLAPPPCPYVKDKVTYQPCFKECEKSSDKDIVIVTNYAKDDENLINMISDFRAVLPYNSRLINIREFPFSGGCLGCFNCAVDGKCIYKDGFDDYLRNQIQSADAIVYAFTISDHFTHSSFKCYDDRQFCNGHRTVTHGIPAAYIISGNYSYERNLQTIIEGRCEVGGTYLCGIASDEFDAKETILSTAKSLEFALKNKLRRPANFYGVGGMKIFRDLIYVMQGLMKADHKFYKENGIYNDFPQKQKARIFQMKAVGAIMAIPSLKKKFKGQMSDFIIMPYMKIVDNAKDNK